MQRSRTFQENGNLHKLKVPNDFGTFLSFYFLRSKDYFFLAAFLGAAFFAAAFLGAAFFAAAFLGAAFFAVAMFLEFNC